MLNILFKLTAKKLIGTKNRLPSVDKLKRLQKIDLHFITHKLSRGLMKKNKSFKPF